MERRSTESTGAYVSWAKRCVDIGVSLVALTALSPLALAVAAVVRAKMGSPVLFRQPRIGRGGTLFTILKFRTMNDARGPDGAVLSDDRRLTPLGLFLRKSSLDEIPQLVNVLRGDMSLVGPRPLLIRYRPWYTPRENTRHDVRPGITGWAQVNGRNALAWDDRLELDAWYVERVSARLDLRIVLSTVAKVLGREGVQADTTGLLALDDERRMVAADRETPPELRSAA